MRSLEPAITEGPRADIVEVVERVPGVHLRSIERHTGLPLGQVLYHLDRLERMGVVVSARDEGFRRFFLVGQVGRDEKSHLAALRHEVPRRLILQLLEAGKPVPHKDLHGPLGVAGSTLSFHLQRLVSSGVLVRERDGASNLYALAEPDLAQRELVYYRESFRDPEVDRYVRGLLASLRVSYQRAQ